MPEKEDNKVRKSGLFPKEYLEEIEDDLNTYLEKEIEQLKQENNFLRMVIGFA